MKETLQVLPAIGQIVDFQRRNRGLQESPHCLAQVRGQTHAAKPPQVIGPDFTKIEREQNPLVQLEMIDFIAAAHDTSAAPVLEKLAQNELIESSVRDAARTALAQL